MFAEDFEDMFSGQTGFDGSLARTGRAARIGAKAGRIVKAARFLRMGRLVLQFMELKQRRDLEREKKQLASEPEGAAMPGAAGPKSGALEKPQSTSVTTMTGLPMDSPVSRPMERPSSDYWNYEAEQADDDYQPAHSLSQRLSRGLTTKVVILFFVLLVVQPFLEADFPDHSTRAMLKSISTVCSMEAPRNQSTTEVAKTMNRYIDGLYFLRACGDVYVEIPTDAPERDAFIYYELLGSDLPTTFNAKETCLNQKYDVETIACVDNTWKKEAEAQMSLFFMLFILFLLPLSSFVIAKDTDYLSNLISRPVSEVCTQMQSLRELDFETAQTEVELEDSGVYEVRRSLDPPNMSAILSYVI